MYSVYWIHLEQHTDPLTEGYIGVSNQPKARFRAHTTDNTSSGSSVVKQMVELYGLTAIKHTILFQDSNFEVAQAKEFEYRPTPNIGWNLAKGGGVSPSNIGRKHSKETVDKITNGVRQTRNNRNYVSPFKGVTNRHSDETRAKIGSYHKGKTISAEHIAAMRLKLSGEHNSKAKSVVVVDTLDNCEYTFKCIRTAATELNIGYSAIRSALRSSNSRLVYKRWLIRYQGTE